MSEETVNMKEDEMIDKYIMDGHKLFWHLDRVHEWQSGKRIAPIHIDLGITTGCNEACVYCYGVLQGRVSASKRIDMDKKVLLRLLKDAKEIGVRSVAFIGEGENTLNEALYDGLCYAKSIDLDTSLATNGINILDKRLKEMVESLVWIRFNISAATPDSFNLIHGARAFEKVKENIRKVVETKKECGLTTVVGMQMVVTGDNIEDIVPLALLGKELGVDYLVIKPCSDTYDGTMQTPHEKYLEIEDIFQKAESCSDKNYKVVVKWKKMQNLGKKPFSKCFGTNFLLQISGDGSVFPCGHFFRFRREEFVMGNVVESSLKDIVASDRYLEVQHKIQNINVNNDCETNCRHYYINKFLWDLNEIPEHVNFI